MEKNKKWIKIFLAFLAVMWLLTIISKSIYVSGLTRVETDTFSKKYIEHIVEADGIVLAGGETAVNTLSGLRVEEICVQKGDKVEKGDVLFRVDLTDLEELTAKKQTEIARLELQLGTAQFNTTLDAQKKEVALLWAKEDYENADKETQTAVDRAQSELTKAENNLQKHLDTSAPHTSSADRKKAWNKYNDWKKRCYALEDKIAELEKEIQALKNAIAEAEKDAQDISEAETETQSEEETGDKTQGQDKAQLLAQKQKELEERRAELTELERNPVAQPDYSAEESAYDAWQQTKTALEDAVQTAKRALEDARSARENTLRQKRRDVATAEVVSGADATIALYAMEIEALEKEIASLNAVKRGQGAVCADIEGYVAEILVATGQRTTDTASMLITDTQSECMFRFSITKEDGKYVRLGDSVTLKLSTGSGAGAGNMGTDVTADYIEENSTGGYDVTCRLGTLKAPIGTYGMVTRTVQGDLYPNTVPIDAIHVENDVCFVFTLNEKTGILGNEYYVEKLKVSVADKNDRYGAIDGAVIGSDTQIVVFSSKELRQGESVRFVE